MKKYLVLSICMLATAGLFAQKRVVPTPEQIERVTRTTTCVVLTGENMIMDAALREAVEKNWKLTPVEFIDKPAFDKTMNDANRTFLLMVNGTFKKDAEMNGYIFLNFLMGGGASLDKLADFMLLPIAGENQDEDMSIALMPALVDIVQRHVQHIQENPKTVKRGLDDYNSNVSLLPTRYILLSAEDIAYDISDDELKKQSNGHISLISADEMVEAATIGATNKVVGFTLQPEGGAYGYNMLIDCSTHELLYFDRHRLKAGNRKGFTKSEIQLFSKSYTK